MNTTQNNPLRSPRPEQDSVLVFVIERIKETLMRKELQPGDYLPSEAELAKSLGVSKTSVREAIKMLQAMGVVDVRRGQRTRIREHPGESLISPMLFQLIIEKGTTKDIVNFRMMFEPAYTLMAMETATQSDIDRIRHTLERLERTIEKGLPTAEDDLTFHQTILQSTHNPFVIQTGRTILQLFKMSIGQSFKENPRKALEDHKRIFEAFCNKDEQQLREAITKSFEGWKYTLEHLSNGGDTDESR